MQIRREPQLSIADYFKLKNMYRDTINYEAEIAKDIYFNEILAILTEDLILKLKGFALEMLQRHLQFQHQIYSRELEYHSHDAQADLNKLDRMLKGHLGVDMRSRNMQRYQTTGFFGIKATAPSSRAESAISSSNNDNSSDSEKFYSIIDSSDSSSCDFFDPYQTRILFGNIDSDSSYDSDSESSCKYRL